MQENNENKGDLNSSNKDNTIEWDYSLMEKEKINAQVNKNDISLCKRNEYYILNEKIVVNNLESLLIYSYDKFLPFSFMTGQKQYGFDNNILKTPSPKYLLDEDFELIPPKLIYSNFFQGSKIDNKEGLILTDPNLLVRFKGLVADMIGQLLKRLVGGPPVSLNVRIFEPRSSLHRNSDLWSYAPIYLSKAANPSISPLDRLKLVTTFGVSGLVLICKQIKPFNPLIGETFEGEFPDGSKIYAEHIGHYPTLSRFLLIGNDNEYRLHCCLDLEAKTEQFGNKIIVIQRGVITVEFPKINEVVYYTIPLMKLKNCTSEKERYSYIFEFFEAYDLKNGLKAMIQFGYNKKSVTDFIGVICSYNKATLNDISSSKERKHTEGYMEVIVKNKEHLQNLASKKLSFFKTEPLPFSTIQGSFVKLLKIDNTIYWDFTTDEAPYIKPLRKVLPSDTRFREDLIWLYYALYYAQTKTEYDKFIGYSQAWKLETEYIQRKERGIRAEYNKKLNKK